MDSSPTLQDFVLNLIYDPLARNAFELDPQGVLESAGLGDVTAADVQEVIPLVVDFAPLAEVGSVVGSLGVTEVTSGVADLDVTGAVTHLQAVTAHLSTGGHPAADLTAATAGAVMVTSDGLLPGAPVVGAGLEHAVTVQSPAYTPADDSLSAVHDPGLGLDAGVSTATSVVSTVVTDGDGLVASTGIDAGATLDVTSRVVTDVAGSAGLSDVVDLDVAHLDPAVSSVVGTVTDSDTLDGVTADPVGGALDVAGDVTSTATGLVDGLGLRPERETEVDNHGAVTDLLF
ncbi:IniB N-terminal domain-containing protein [Jidongwangia harbinensis]|uniref:IniB N-terminal domain-containing protein n=1 Tax=Jidongwangia harbinensis TaxID=2878561 RepID=UPI001CD9897F|nr:IniB N-terminal domain-containing protein [Jidongwangia harbinensis]MCA2217812.1 IniB N-terminal domain-containing protein [Jidongwangia harbinensis]